MKRKLTQLALAVLVTMSLAVTARAATVDPELKSAAEDAIMKVKAKSPGIEAYFDTAAGYAVFPGVGKGGLIIGGERGRGVVYEKGKVIGEATLTEASIGAQIGGESFAEFIFFETPEVLQEFKQGKFNMDATVHGVVADKGVEKSVKFDHGIAVFVLPKAGVMGEAAIGGQKFKFKPSTSE